MPPAPTDPVALEAAPVITAMATNMSELLVGLVPPVVLRARIAEAVKRVRSSTIAELEFRKVPPPDGCKRWRELTGLLDAEP